MHANHKISAFFGEVSGFNLSPKGVPEGILFELADDGGTVQINFDPQVAGQVTAVAVMGMALTVDAAESDVHAEAVHSVFDLTRISNGSGKVLFVAEGASEPDVFLRGKIVRLNHARRGEVNGGILDSGEFVHLKPHGVKAIGGLSVGQILEAQGEVRSGWSGTRVVEARIANGVELMKPHKPHGPKDNPKLKAAAR